MTIEKDEIPGALRGLIEDIGLLGDALHNRLNGGDIPWNAAGEIQGEFSGEFDKLEKAARLILTALEA